MKNINYAITIMKQIEMEEQQEPCHCCDRGFVRDEMVFDKVNEVYYCSTCSEMLDARAQAAYENYMEVLYGDC